MSTTRISSIDFIRVLAMFAVILIHARSFVVYTPILDQSARFAVPFFFIIAGYLVGKKLDTGKSLNQVFLRYGSRILWIFLFWSLVYLLLPLLSLKIFTLQGFGETIKILFQNLTNILNQPKEFFFLGTKVHLWFLSALIQSLLIAVVLIKLKLRAYFIPIALLLYVFGLIAGSYSTTPLGLSIDFNTRNGPFFGTIFFAIGLYFSQSRKSFSLTFAIVLTLLGFLLHFLEIFVLWHFYYISPLRHDYLLGTVLFGTGVALIALAKPSLGKNLFITQFGPYMLGVYVVHVAFVEYLSAFRFNHILWEVVFPIVVFVASLLTTVVLAKFRLLRRFVI